MDLPSILSSWSNVICVNRKNYSEGNFDMDSDLFTLKCLNCSFKKVFGEDFIKVKSSEKELTIVWRLKVWNKYFTFPYITKANKDTIEKESY